ncbi:hypothetical protein [Mesorhizobium sp. M4B.F.Ca.ET.017.02.2.1]|uniref:hypothetical protein n=1 Tax=Mesorhizobium sp. M4B.F.Ca.ET.017.02.2.1 TaxID=2496649 RepID=UPI000FCBE211|nr:hypothetical protein [Mesorhizobium sp. M4B.F.Ca.ET.017.02.2.1]RVD20424.1 hypothetical protein EN738_22680 [Mesorhizobium sp. M4B.F.Ca.ET.017.02.2.1]
MTKVAADYGVTGTALKKTCDRHHIPTPERGYWAKLEYGKRVKQAALPPLPEPNLALVRISGGTEQHLSPSVREAKEKARDRLTKHAAANPISVSKPDLPSNTAEPSCLAATRRAITKARPDHEGFASVRSKGVVPLRIAPASIERGISVLGQLFALAETQGHLPKATEDGLVLAVGNESVAFGMEEQPQKSLHQPTPQELKQRDERMRWGYTTDPWPKYDQSPSGRLAIVIHANPYSGLRRTYSDGQTQALESKLPDILAGFAGHAAFISERRREKEERDRRHRDAEAQRQREEAYDSREKRRTEFVDAVHEQLTNRDKLVAVLTHLENIAPEHVDRVSAMTTWIRLRLKQIDALISPDFLDISARSAKVDFIEPDPEKERERGGGYFGYSHPIKLDLWTVDIEKGVATSCSPLDWVNAARPQIEKDQAG